jgi:hypothetical protein
VAFTPAEFATFMSTARRLPWSSYKHGNTIWLGLNAGGLAAELAKVSFR